MRRTLLSILAALSGVSWSSAEIIAQWNFNSPSPDAKTSTGTQEPCVGTGKATLVGGVSGAYANGSAKDPASSDNSGWSIASYPAQGSGNKTAGVQFSVSTAGYSNIQVAWQHRVSASASKYCRLQYSIDDLSFY